MDQTHTEIQGNHRKGMPPAKSHQGGPWRGEQVGILTLVSGQQRQRLKTDGGDWGKGWILHVGPHCQWEQYVILVGIVTFPVHQTCSGFDLVRDLQV
jgi:hypothetical protein